MEETNGKRGGQPDNDNARRGAIVRAAIRKALANGDAAGRDRLNTVVERMLSDAEQGDAGARRELFDRLDGKPVQGTEISGPDGEAQKHSITVTFGGG